MKFCIHSWISDFSWKIFCPEGSRFLHGFCLIWRAKELWPTGMRIQVSTATWVHNLSSYTVGGWRDLRIYYFTSVSNFVLVCVHVHVCALFLNVSFTAVHVCGYMHVNAGNPGSQKEESGPLELESQTVVSCCCRCRFTLGLTRPSLLSDLSRLCF